MMIFDPVHLSRPVVFIYVSHCVLRSQHSTHSYVGSRLAHLLNLLLLSSVVTLAARPGNGFAPFRFFPILFLPVRISLAVSQAILSQSITFITPQYFRERERTLQAYGPFKLPI
jgi:hypothetical protein